MADRQRCRRVAATVLTGFGILLTGCSEDPDPEATRAERLPERKQALSSGPPDSRSGDLGQEDLPAPGALGKGWEYRVDKGNPEDGYVGSGEPAIARDPASVMAAITPLGCPPQQMPMPARALEVTYERKSVPGVGLILQFAEAEAAQQFFATHTDVLRDCVDAKRVDVDVLHDSSSGFVSSRTEQLGRTPTWVEGLTVDGEEVRLIAIADPTRRGVQSVVAAMR